MNGPDVRDRLYRFEMAFDGEYQGCGIFNGLYEVGLPEGAPEAIEGLFDGLVAPIYTEPCLFWFTRKGLERFAVALLGLLDVVGPYMWTLLMARMDDRPPRGDPDVLYEDEYQVAIRESARPNRQEDYEEIPASFLEDIARGQQEEQTQ